MLTPTSEPKLHQRITRPEQTHESMKLAVTQDQRTQLIERFRCLLATKNLNVNLVSRKTAQVFGASSPYFIPHNFCYNLVANRASPNIFQIFALSQVTGYDLSHFLTLFGCAPETISRFQLTLHSERTVLLPSANYDSHKVVPFLGSTVDPIAMDKTGPLATKVRYDASLRAGAVAECSRHSFLYAKIGQQDALAFPDLIPGSIVRVDQRRAAIHPRQHSNGHGLASRPLFLVECPGGLVCCHVDLVDRDHLLLSPSSLPFASMQYRQNAEAVILGTVDAEIRPLQAVGPPHVNSFARFARVAGVRRVLPRSVTLAGLLRLSRERNAMTVRQAHEMTLRIATQLGNSEYAISTGSLFEFEATNTPPRHLEKLFSLCMVYNLDLWRLLRAIALDPEKAGREPMPNHYLYLSKRTSPTSSSNRSPAPTQQSFCSYVNEKLEEIPLFLLPGLSQLASGVERTSRELFWVGRNELAYHPWLEGAALIAVDTTTNGKTLDSTWVEPWERPIYLLLKRDHTFMIGFCSFGQGRITLMPHPESKAPVQQFLDGKDAEIIGRVTAVARLFPR